MLLRRLLLLLACSVAGVAHAGAPAPFDLAGPLLEASVTRGEQALPAAEVPNLAVGDRIWVRADLPATQSAHYLMVLAFLSGSTNPPPESWFYSCKTWGGKCAHGLSVTVPEGAQQVLLFLAPATSGDFSTLRDAVRGRPGSFVRASQDLNQASLDRSRLERYMSGVRTLENTDPAKLKDVAPLLARSLAIKVDDKCLDRVIDLQAPCLMQGQESLILNDGHSTSIVEALTSGVSSDLLLEASSTPQLGYGYYSPYIASVLDIARILDSFGSAEYQYIPALSAHRDGKLSLSLNAAPSFHNPRSVLVVALPAVEDAQLPPLHAVDPKEVYCACRKSLLLPADGAPLVFSTSYAHDLSLSLDTGDGKTIALPVKADAAQGGLVVDTAALAAAKPGQAWQATLQGYWGFQSYQGPGFRLRNAMAKPPVLADDSAQGLVAGRQNVVRLQADGVACIEDIRLRDAAGKELKTDWQAVSANLIEATLPLQDQRPGPLTLLVHQYGEAEPQAIALQTYADPGRFDGFLIHAGDTQGVLKGSSLGDVVKLTLGGVGFVPQAQFSGQRPDELTLAAQDAKAAAGLVPAAAAAGNVTLKDGRVLPVTAVIAPARPQVLLCGKSVQASRAGGASNIELANQDELPQDASLTFSVRAQSPGTFGHDQALEVSTSDGAFSTLLNLGNGGLVLEDARIAVATLEPLKAFGASAFGPLQFRVLANGATGDWQPLATLVRLPVLKELKCPPPTDLACRLSGADLFLVDSVAADPQFTHAVQVPDGFPGYTLPVPRPSDGRLYVKLRDDPATIDPVALEVQTLTPSPQEFVRPGTGPGAASAAPATAPTGEAAASPPAAAKPDAAAQAPAAAPSAAPNGTTVAPVQAAAHPAS